MYETRKMKIKFTKYCPHHLIRMVGRVMVTRIQLSLCMTMPKKQQLKYLNLNKMLEMFSQIHMS